MFVLIFLISNRKREKEKSLFAEWKIYRSRADTAAVVLCRKAERELRPREEMYAKHSSVEMHSSHALSLRPFCVFSCKRSAFSGDSKAFWVLEACQHIANLRLLMIEFLGRELANHKRNVHLLIEASPGGKFNNREKFKSRPSFTNFLICALHGFHRNISQPDLITDWCECFAAFLVSLLNFDAFHWLTTLNAISINSPVKWEFRHRLGYRLEAVDR